MSNMKRLLSIISALGFASITAGNVVACSNSNNGGSINNDDLGKSFNKSYQALGTSSDAGVDKLGLKKDATDNTYNFSASKLEEKAVQTWVYSINDKAPVTNKVVKDINSVGKPKAIGIKVAQFTAQDQTKLQVQDNIVSFKITLQLYQSVADAGNPFIFNYQFTGETMDININVATVDNRTDVKSLTKITIANTAAGNIDVFKTNLVTEINKQDKFKKFSINNIDNLQVQGSSTPKPLAINDLASSTTTKSLSLIIIINPNDINFKNSDSSSVTVTVTITKIDKVDISNITSVNVTTSIHQVTDFTIALYQQLAKDKTYPALDQNTLTLTKDGTNSLADGDIVNNDNLKVVLTAPSSNAYYTGTANITVKLTVNQINLSGLNNQTVTVTGVKSEDVAAFKTNLVTAITNDPKLSEFKNLTKDNIDLYNDAKEIVTNQNLLVTLYVNSTTPGDFTGTANITVNLTTN